VKAAVLGGGSWGTTFAQVLCDAGTPVVLWCRRPELAAQINSTHTSPQYLPGVTLPASLRATADAPAALADADMVMLAIPAQSLRQNLTGWRDLVPANAILVSLIKGVELGTGYRMSQVIAEVTGASEDRIAVISGPNLALEIAAKRYCATVAACADEAVATRLQHACHTGYFRAYTNPDVIGCELGGAVKNVIALAVGIAAGMGLGDNTRATVMTRGLAEITRLGTALGADQHTFAGLAGMGDLVASCSSPLARNHSFGEKLGRGVPLEQVTASTTQTVEGVKSSESVRQLARDHGVEMPITEVIAGIMHEGLAITDGLLLLTSRSAKPERYGV
jgi:glycerol-3-phosphate dehydrogenase (NAD(P)+)